MNENMILRTVPAANDLHKVPGFDPMKYLRKTVNEKGEPVMRLPPHYQRLWFRLACPKGRMLLNPLRVTDQMAIFEAKVFFHREDTAPASRFTATKTAQETAGYIRAAQDEALTVALDNAGFGIQLCDVTHGPSDDKSCPPTPVVQESSGKQQAPPTSNPAPVPPVQAVETPAAAEPAPEPAPLVQAAPVSEPAPTEQAAPVSEPAPAVQPAAFEQTTEAAAVENDPEPITTPQNVPADDPAPAPKEHQEPLDTEQREEPAASAVQQSEAVAVLDFFSQPEAADTPADDVPKQVETPPPAAPSYTDDMSVEEICQVMTLEEAGAIVVPSGPNKGSTMAQIAEYRPSSLRFFMTPFYKCSNSEKAAATLLIQDIDMKKAG